MWTWCGGSFPLLQSYLILSRAGMSPKGTNRSVLRSFLAILKQLPWRHFVRYHLECLPSFG